MQSNLPKKDYEHSKQEERDHILLLFLCQEKRTMSNRHRNGEKMSIS